MYNRAILVGRLTADPELKQTPSGVAVCAFSIACDRPYKGTDGNKQVDFLDIVVWRQTAEFVSRYFSKGRAILVEGSIQARSYVDKNGNNRRVWEVVADNCRFVESKQSAQGAGADVSHGAPIPSRNVTAAQPPVQDLDDHLTDEGDLPF